MFPVRKEKLIILTDLISGISLLLDNIYREKFTGTLIEIKSFGKVSEYTNIIQEIYYKGNTTDTCTVERTLLIKEINNIIIHTIIGSKETIYTSYDSDETCFYNAELNREQGWNYITSGFRPLFYILIIIIMFTIWNYNAICKGRFFNNNWYTQPELSEDIEMR